MRTKNPIIQYWLYYIFFCITNIIFFISYLGGTEGISLKLFGGGDDGYFYWQQVNNILNGIEPTITSLYVPIIGNIVKFIGIKSVYIIRIFNFIGFISLVNILLKLRDIIANDQDATLKLYRSKSKQTILIIMLFYFSLIMNVTLSIYRDVWIYLFYAICTFLCIKIFFQKERVFLNLIMLMIFLYLLYGFRDYALIAFFTANILYIVLKNIKNKIYFILLIYGIFIFYYTFLLDYSIPFFNETLRSALDYRMIGMEEFGGGSQMNIKLAQSNVIYFTINYIHSYIGNLLGPLPWHISGASTLLVFFVETLPMIYILKRIYDKRQKLTSIQIYILTVAFTWIGFIAFTNDNVGTATRLRPLAWLLIIIVFAVVNKKEIRNKKGRFDLSTHIN